MPQKDEERQETDSRLLTAQMTRLVADLLDVAGFDAGKLVLVRGLRDARRIVRERMRV